MEWTARRNKIRKREACERWIGYGNTLDVRWTEHRCNEEVLQQVQEENTIIKTTHTHQQTRNLSVIIPLHHLSQPVSMDYLQLCQPLVECEALSVDTAPPHAACVAAYINVSK